MSENNNQDSWFFDFLKSGEDFSLNLNTSDFTGETNLYINTLSQKNGQVLGVSGLGLDVSYLNREIAKYQFGQQGKVFLASTSGKIEMFKFDNLVLCFVVLR